MCCRRGLKLWAKKALLVLFGTFISRVTARCRRANGVLSLTLLVRRVALHHRPLSGALAGLSPRLGVPQTPRRSAKTAPALPSRSASNQAVNCSSWSPGSSPWIQPRLPPPTFNLYVVFARSPQVSAHCNSFLPDRVVYKACGAGFEFPVTPVWRSVLLGTHFSV